MGRPPAQPNFELTTAEKTALRLFNAYLARHGHAPTFRELAVLLGYVHPNVGTYYVKALRAKGALTPQPKGKVRLSAKLTAKGKKAIGL